MVKRIYISLITLIIISCSEGDILEIPLDIFDESLQNCANESDNTFVFFVIDEDTNTSLSVNFTDTNFEINPMTVEDITLDEPTVITLNTSTNQLLYREFNTAINGDEYFCNSVPVSDINVTQELISSNGTVEISYVLQNTTATATIYERTLTLKDITLEGNGIAIRRELLVLGTDTVEIPN
ncbi:hypothetical protein [Aquimarina litoralis]|uniref:hypothetical protein n=1 Tax=Aquimarina litoralis TaxID=584605 RepID=UPI001C5839E7|nr:hypothetical protein [Aquimarina litoralis]MBW1296791.1 hypothetical protein [Aquimarina litoralis]